jgi:menaquinone-dependent protoporphyrinogen IX oxidase
MKFLVVYYSRGGKTRRVTEVIAQQLRCAVVDLERETPDIAGVDMLIVGSGQYPDFFSNKLHSFLDGLQPSNKNKAVVFATVEGSNPKVFFK